MKKLRKVLLGVSAACVLACTAGAFAACGGNTPPAHQHTWSDWTEKTAATCTAAQKLERNCTDENCPGGGHEEKDGTAALDHDWTDWAEETPADCTHAQVLEHHCQRTGCEEKDTKDGTAALDHDWNWTTESEATCTAGKHETATCKRDGCEATHERTGDPLGHDWTEWAEESPADCTHAQVLEHHCQRTGCTESDTKDGTPAFEHSWVATTRITKPTETATGMAQLRCNNSGCTERKNVVLPVLGGDEYKTTVTKEATCSVAGTMAYTYNVPDCPGVEVKFNVAIDKLPHNNSGWTVTAAPSEGQEGYAQWQTACTLGCGGTGITALPKLDEDAAATQAFYDITVDGDYTVFTVKESVATEKFDGENLGSWRVRNYTALTLETTQVNFETYVFKTDADGNFTLTVPAGACVEIDNEVLITGEKDAKTTVNFAAKANKKYYITFSQCTEAEAPEVTAPLTVSLTEAAGPEIDLATPFVWDAPQYCETRKVTVGDIEEGSYTITMAYNSKDNRAWQMGTYFALYVNKDDSEATTNNPGQGATATFSYFAKTFTLNLKKGDKLLFKDINSTYRLTDITFTLTKA